MRFALFSVSLDLEEILEAILDGLKSILDYDAAAIYVVEPESGQLRSQIVRGYRRMKWLSPEPTPQGKGAIGRVLEVGAPVLIPDVAANPDYVEVQRSTRSEMAAPIVGSGGHPIGVFIWNPMERTPITVVLDVATLFYVEVEVKVGLTHS